MASALSQGWTAARPPRLHYSGNLLRVPPSAFRLPPLGRSKQRPYIRPPPSAFRPHPFGRTPGTERRSVRTIRQPHYSARYMKEGSAMHTSRRTKWYALLAVGAAALPGLRAGAQTATVTVNAGTPLGTV